MTADFVRLVSLLPDPLVLAGLFLVTGFLVTRLALSPDFSHSVGASGRRI